MYIFDGWKAKQDCNKIVIYRELEIVKGHGPIVHEKVASLTVHTQQDLASKTAFANLLHSLPVVIELMNRAIAVDTTGRGYPIEITEIKMVAQWLHEQLIKGL